MSQEELQFSITLSGTYWDKKPRFSISLDNKEIVSDEIDEPSSLLKTFSFTEKITEGDHFLKIRLNNKEDQDTVVSNGEVIKDMLLNIEDIVIDDVSLGNLLWQAEYVLDNPKQYKGEVINHLDHCVNLGWNGTYVLKFSSPFYIWLLERL